MNKKPMFGQCLLFLLVSLIVTTDLYQSPGIVGHNWDWSISPYEPAQYYYDEASFVWRKMNFGFFSSIGISTMLSNLFFHGITLFISPELTSKILITFTILISSLTSSVLFEELGAYIIKGKRRKYQYSIILGSLLYSLSPFLFNEICGGAITQFMAYSLFPLPFYYYIRYLRTNGSKELVYLILSLSLLVISIHTLFISTIFLFLLYIMTRNHFPRKNLYYSIISFMLLNAYWILPTVYGFQSVSARIGGAERSLEIFYEGTPTVYDAFLGRGYFRQLFTYAIPAEIQPIWVISSFTLFLLFIYFIIISNRVESNIIILFFLFWIIVVTGARAPFGKATLMIFKYTPLGILFRSPQHLILSTSFLFSSIGFLGIASMEESGFLNEGWRKLALLIIVCFYSLPFWYGDFNHHYVREHYGPGNSFDVYSLPPDQREMLDLINADKTLFRTINMPLSFSPNYLKTGYQNEAQGGDPLVLTLQKPGFSTGLTLDLQSQGFIEAFRDEFYIGTNRSKQASLFSLTNGKYIFLRRDVIPNFGIDVELWNITKIINDLETNEAFIQLKEGGDASLYRVRDTHFLPRIYPRPTNQTMEGPSIYQPAQARIAFSRVNPTKYYIHLEATEPFHLVFLESFHPMWRLYLAEERHPCYPITEHQGEGVTECIHEKQLFETNDITSIIQQPVSDNRHFRVNEYGQAWHLDPARLDRNGDGEFDLILFFQPQSYFVIGLIVSFTTLLLLPFFTIYVWNNK